MQRGGGEVLAKGVRVNPQWLRSAAMLARPPPLPGHRRQGQGPAHQGQVLPAGPPPRCRRRRCAGRARRRRGLRPSAGSRSLWLEAALRCPARTRFGVAVAADHDRDGRAHRTVIEAGLDPGEVERVEDKLHFPAHQGRVHLITVGEQADRGRLGDGADSDHKNASCRSSALG